MIHTRGAELKKGQLDDKVLETGVLTFQRHLRVQEAATYLVECKRADKTQLLETEEQGLLKG